MTPPPPLGPETLGGSFVQSTSKSTLALPWVLEVFLARFPVSVMSVRVRTTRVKTSGTQGTLALFKTKNYDFR